MKSGLTLFIASVLLGLNLPNLKAAEFNFLHHYINRDMPAKPVAWEITV